MKTYFLAFDFFNDDISKYWYGIVEMDLKKDKLNDVARKKVKEVLPNYEQGVNIKIIAFNNID